jgi:hypothetical protein
MYERRNIYFDCDPKRWFQMLYEEISNGFRVQLIHFDVMITSEAQTKSVDEMKSDALFEVSMLCVSLFKEPKHELRLKEQ